MEQVLQNEEGKQVLPLSEYSPVNPRPDVIFNDELYNSLKSGLPAGDQTPTEGAPVDSGVSNDPIVDPPAAPAAPAAQDATGGESQADPASAPPVDQPPASAPAIDLDSLIKDKTGGKFEKLDDLLKLSDKPAAAEIEFANDQSKLVYEYLQQGKIEEVSTFLAQQQYLKNVESFKADELLQLKIAMTMSDLTPEEQADEYRDQLERYGLDVKKDDFLTEEEYDKAIRKGQRRLKADLSGFVEEVKAFRAELKLPELQATAPAAAQVTKSDLDVFIEALSKDPSLNTPTLSEIKLSSNVDKDVNVDYAFQVDEAQKSELSSALRDYETDFKRRYVKADGTYNAEAIQRDLFIRNNFDKIVAAAVKEGYMKGKLNQTLGLANATNGQTPVATGTPTDVAAQARMESLRDFIMR